MSITDDSRAVAIIGMACRFPDANDVSTFWENMSAAKTSFTPIPEHRWNHAAFHSDRPREHDKTYVTHGAFLDDVAKFAALHFGIAPRRVAVMDPQHRLMLEAVRTALQDAGLERRPFNRRMTGTFLGVSSSEYRGMLTGRTLAMLMADGSMGATPNEEGSRAIATSVERLEPINAFTIPGALLNMTAANVASQWRLGGPAFTIDAACASALVAVYDAVTYLRSGICSTAIAGGVYLNLTPENLIGFARASAISRSGECRPFDANADGFVQGEGVGVLILKRLEDAKRDHDRVYAVIRGVGINNDGSGEGPMAPNRTGQLECLQRAHWDAGTDPDSIDLVECHGTATAVGDPVEVGALRDYFCDGNTTQTPIYLSSVKANIGHTMSTAGIAGLMRAVLAMQHESIPPQAGFTTPHPDLPIDNCRLTISTQAVPWPRRADHVRRAGISSFGFGATNCHVIVEEAPEETLVIEVSNTAPPTAELVILSADTRALLSEHARKVADAVEASQATLKNIAYTLTGTRLHEQMRLAVVVKSREDLCETLRNAADKLTAPNVATQIDRTILTTPDGRGDAPPKVAFMFAGQGAQRVGLLRGFYDRFESFRRRLDEMQAALDGILEKPLLDYLYPADDVDTEAAEKALQATEICQPAMAALGLAMAGFLRKLGVTPAVSFGHSLGEFAAAACGGLFSDADAVRFVARRGRMMADAKLDDTGAMAAVRGSPEAIRPHLQDGCVIANINHAEQTVISGTSVGVAETIEVLKRNRISARSLRVSHAFHSPVLQPVATKVAGLVDDLVLSTVKEPVISAIHPGLYPAADEDLEAARNIFRDHATSPVQFTAAIDRADALGIDLFLQVGAGNTLSKLVAPTPNSARLAATMASDKIDDGVELGRALGLLTVLGLDLDWSQIFDSAERTLVTLPETPLTRDRYWAIREGKGVKVNVTAGSNVAATTTTTTTATTTAAAQINTDTISRDNEDLVALFREQTALLKQQADILEHQAAALAGRGISTPLHHAAATVPAAAQTHAAGPVTQPRSEPQPSSGLLARALKSIDVLDSFLDAVAKVSAFPKEALKPSQTLANDLGLDSLMFVDLSTAVATAFPGLDGIPQSLISQTTTIADVVAYIEDELQKTSAEPAMSFTQGIELEQKLERYRPTLVARPTADLPGAGLATDGWLLVTTSEGIHSEELIIQLLGRGHSIVVAPMGTPGSIERDGKRVTAPCANTPEAVEQLFTKLAGLDIAPKGVLHLAAATTQAPIDEVVDGKLPWPNTVLVAQALAANVERSSADAPAAFVVVTGMGGSFGLDGHNSHRIWQTALCGFAKSLAREWPSTIVKSIDVELDAPGDHLAAQIVREMAASNCDVEVAFNNGGRFVIDLKPADFTQDRPLQLDRQSVLLVTGGGGGLGALVGRHLAMQTGCAVALVDNRPESDPGVAGTLALMKADGVRATLVTWDVQQAAAADEQLQRVRDCFGPITAVIHCAGVIRDKRVGSKTIEDAKLVSNIKVGGLINVLRATATDPVRTVLTFSSWAGRFGNVGQTDYAAANELMSRLSTALASVRTDCKITSIAWPPWETSVMAQSIPEPIRAAMRAEGVTFVQDAAGLAALSDELTCADGTEVLYGVDVPTSTFEVRGSFPLSLSTHPFLGDHRVGGTPLLPMASALDYVATAAQAVAGNQPLVVKNLQLYAGIEVSTPTPLEVRMQARRFANGQYSAKLELRAHDKLAYRAEAGGDGGFPKVSIPPGPTLHGSELPFSLDTLYGDIIFHGPRLRGIERVEELGTTHIIGWVKPSCPADWITSPTRKSWTIDPLVIDSSFQLVLYWMWAQKRRLALPVGLGAFVQHAPFGDGPIKCTAVLRSAGDDTFVGSISYEDKDGNLLALVHDARAKAVEASRKAPAVDVDEKHYRIEKFDEVAGLFQRLEMASLMGLKNPYFPIHDGIARGTAVINGQEMINYSSYNYLGLSGHPAVSTAAQEAVARYGTSASASRVASGEIPLHLELEAALSDMLGCESAIVFAAGHMTNETTIGHLLGEGDLIIHDALAHNSIQEGAKLSGAKRRPFPHNDWAALDAILSQIRSNFNRVLVAIEGVYSMDGDIPDLPRFIEVRDKYRCLLMVDEAHSVGVIGATGCGIGELFGVERTRVDIWMGTLSKSLSSCGGYVAGTKALVEYLKYTAPAFVFSAGISPANAAAAKAAIEQMRAHPELVQQLHDNSALFLSLAKARGIDTGLSGGSAVIPVVVGNSLLSMKLAENLGKRGINSQPIVYPAVDEDAARLRFFLSSTHTQDQIQRTVDIIAEELAALREDSPKPKPKPKQPLAS